MVWQVGKSDRIANRGYMLQTPGTMFRLACLMVVTVILLSACGGDTGAPIATIRGPALLFFYTDN